MSQAIAAIAAFAAACRSLRVCLGQRAILLAEVAGRADQENTRQVV